jgi:hypothetical protein
LNYALFRQNPLANGAGVDKQLHEAKAAESDEKDEYFAAKREAEVARVQFCTQAKLELGIPELVLQP